MATILFDIFPATGHLNAVAGLAHRLQEQGHRVVFIGPTSIVHLVHSFGFEFHLVLPFIYRVNEQESRSRGMLGYFWEGILEYFTQQRYQEMMKVVENYDQLLEKLRPDLVVLDEHFLGKAMYYQRKKVKLLTVQTTVATERGAYVPPFQSAFIPRRTRFSKMFIQSLWFLHKLNKVRKLTYHKLLSVGNDYFSLQKKMADEATLPFKKTICFDQSYSFRFKDLPCLIIPPRSFDFPRGSHLNLFWINPLTRPTKAVTVDRRYQQVVEFLTEQEHRKTYDKLIYCSLGSLTNLRLKISQRFFQKMVKVSAAHPEHRFILCTGKFSHVDQLLPTPPNLYLFAHVPQTDLLAHCDLMITHGGVNSITECINATVPMLVYPLFSTLDQRGNAARVVFHKLGVRGNIRRDSWQTISAKLQQLVTHWNHYKTNVQKMKACCEQPNDHNALEIIEDLIADQKSIAA